MNPVEDKNLVNLFASEHAVGHGLFSSPAIALYAEKRFDDAFAKLNAFIESERAKCAADPTYLERIYRSDPQENNENKLT